MATNKAGEQAVAQGGAKAKGREPVTVSLQTAWFQRNKGRAITARLLDGTRLTGTLEGWDTYTVALRMAGREEQVLVNKHAIALFRRVEAVDQEKAT